MNAHINTFFTAFAAVAAAAILALALAEPTETSPAPSAQSVVKLERVVVVGKAARGADNAVLAERIETLPRVVVTGQRAPVDTQMASL